METKTGKWKIGEWKRTKKFSMRPKNPFSKSICHPRKNLSIQIVKRPWELWAKCGIKMEICLFDKAVGAVSSKDLSLWREALCLRSIREAFRRSGERQDYAWLRNWNASRQPKLCQPWVNFTTVCHQNTKLSQSIQIWTLMPKKCYTERKGLPKKVFTKWIHWSNQKSWERFKIFWRTILIRQFRKVKI